MSLRVHAICVALNEEVFLPNLLKTLYPFCSGISVLTQYDRNWHGDPVEPDRTVELALNHPDPEGKIHLVARRFPDETAARNSEMLAWTARPTRGIIHMREKALVEAFHQAPDYFLLVDADEIYDPETFPAILERLERRRPRAMRVWGYNYVRSWNRRCPPSEVEFCHFGFIRAGLLFQSRRKITFNNSRLAKLLGMLRLPDFSDRLFGFDTCPIEVGHFHHGCWIGDNARLAFKAERQSHREELGGRSFVEGYADRADAYKTESVPTADLPASIREGVWPADYFEEPPAPE